MAQIINKRVSEILYAYLAFDVLLNAAIFYVGYRLITTEISVAITMSEISDEGINLLNTHLALWGLSMLSLIGVSWALMKWINASYEACSPAGTQKKWKVWGWIIPGVNLYLPFFVIRDMAQLKRPLAVVGTLMLIIWWAVWLWSHSYYWQFLSRFISLNFFNSINLPDDLISILAAQGLSSGYSIFNSLLWVGIVFFINKRLESA